MEEPFLSSRTDGEIPVEDRIDLEALYILDAATSEEKVRIIAEERCQIALRIAVLKVRDQAFTTSHR